MLSSHAIRRTKIIATLGPATDDRATLKKLIEAGVNCVRINFSHGEHAAHAKRIQLVRDVCDELKCVVGILGDLQGPKIRIAQFKNKKIQLTAGQSFILDAAHDAHAGDEHIVGIDYTALPNDVQANDILLLDDGRITLVVIAVKNTQIHCEVLSGGELSNNKGINKKNGGLSAKALTDKDRDDIVFALSLNVDFIALSFPRSREDVIEAKKIIHDHQGDCHVIAKIERTEAVTNLDDIIIESDGVMVARGDLAVEIGDAEVPMVQKHIVKRARTLDRPVIIATQMMESMISAPVPTRAEVSDVANAVLDNADAIMCSAETAVGHYPVETIEAMARVCLAVEKQKESQVSKHRVECEFQRIDEVIAMSAMYAANHFEVRCVIALTESGATALWMSRIRTKLPIYGLSRFARTLARMTLYRGVFPIYFDVTQCSRDNVNQTAIDLMREKQLVALGDRVILTKGDHLGRSGGSNAMKIVNVGDVV